MKVALITGVSSGIGEATALELLKAGYGVLGNARSQNKLSALESQWGKQFCGVAGDINEESLWGELFERAKAHFGEAVRIVVANAGQGLGGSVLEVDMAHFERVLKLNVTATLGLIQKAGQNLLALPDLAQLGADIVVIGSVVGRHISPFSAAYGATKFAVHALTEGLRRELGPKGVRVTLVEPGFVLSGFQAGAGYSDEMMESLKEKMGPMLLGEDVARAIHFVIAQPPHVHVSDILIRPTRQDYP